MRTIIRITAALLLAAPVIAAPADQADLQALREQVRALEQQLKALSHQLELREVAAAAETKAAPKVTISDKGFTLASPDNANSIRLRGLVQLDSRLFFGDQGVTNNAFVLRRARIITEGTFAKNFSFQLVPEFGGSSVSILDANVGIAVSKALQLKFGKFKPPVGIELLQSDSWTFFNERSIVTNLVPNRDLGVQASGDVLGGTLNYAVGVFGGVADGGSSTNTDFDNEKDFVLRLFATPFKNDKESGLRGLSFGVAASVGREKTAAGRTAGYRTDGQQTFFAYNAATIADGRTWRVSPQLDFRHGPFGAIAEYVVSTVNVRPSAAGPKAEIRNEGWQVAGGYVLTGEDSAYSGVVPRTNFDLEAGTWGAFEVTGRVANLSVDDAAFPLYASATSNASEATAIGAGVNWYLSKTVAFKFDYYQTRFGFPVGSPAVSASPILQQDEQVLISRFQVSF
ncbi:MAG TPA: porin [Opitutaceae bacterium]|nr:porin [Opitutaceae bacterium]HND60787.1 porin [Opitutaceae bacterium]